MQVSKVFKLFQTHPNQTHSNKRKENAIVEFPDYQIPATSLVGMLTDNFIIFLWYREILGIKGKKLRNCLIVWA